MRGGEEERRGEKERRREKEREGERRKKGFLRCDKVCDKGCGKKRVRHTSASWHVANPFATIKGCF